MRLIKGIQDTDYIDDEMDISISKDPTPDVDLSHIDQLKICPRCKKPLVPALAISGTESSCFLECPACGTLVNTFKPLPHQAAYMRNPKRYKMTAGGYGSGKSASDIQYAIKHIMLIPRARVCVCARSYPALESTFVDDFEEAFPDKLLKSHNKQTHEYVFTNGASLLLRSFDDPTKLKSMNLTLVIIIEASDVPASGFTMMQSRLRNNYAMIPDKDLNGDIKQEWDPKSKIYKIVYKYDARYILQETNPASNHVKNFLLDSSQVEYYGSAHSEGYQFSKHPDKYKYTQIVDTDANPYLPSTYIDELIKDKTPAWVAQFIHGSFNFNNNLVFPNIGLCIKEPHELPRRFDEYGRRTLYFLIGLDYGIVDNTHVIFLAYSTEQRKLYLYDELRINNADVKTIAREYRKELKINGTDLDGLLMQPRFDGRSYNKRESDLHTIGGAFEACGLYFTPCFANHEIRIIKLNSFINHDQIEIFSTCEFVIEELLNYTFVLDKNGNPTKTPKDGKDHGITALEFATVDLPHNLKELKLSAYLPTGEKIVHDKDLEPKPKPKVHRYNPLEEVNNDNNTDYTDYSFGCVPCAIDPTDNDDEEPKELGFFSGYQGE